MYTLSPNKKSFFFQFFITSLLVVFMCLGDAHPIDMILLPFAYIDGCSVLACFGKDVTGKKKSSEKLHPLFFFFLLLTIILAAYTIDYYPARTCEQQVCFFFSLVTS